MQDAVQTEQNRASPVIRQPQALLQSPATPPSRNMSLTSDLLTRPLSASRNGLGCLTCGRPVSPTDRREANRCCSDLTGAPLFVGPSYAAEGITVDGQPLHKSVSGSLLLTSTIVRPTGVYCQQHAPAEASMYKYIRPLTLNGDLKAGNLSMFEEKLTRRLEETDCVRPDPSDSRLAFASVLENTNGRSGHDVGSCLQPTSAADAGVRATAGKGFADKQAQQPKQPQQQPLLRPAPPPLRTATAPEDGHAGRSRDDAEVTDEERPGDFLNLCLGLFDGSTEVRGRLGGIPASQRS
ncbi:MAG: hypothetical protein BJ554DRAFT_1570 [Olpidium bornovanus]|uniref:Uncharacterized protein n=1 Tax=Olpidium bornovanus TaxID=278681 RepID=A0A8H8DHL3_9FUNG|nr:MAG: hypothetical protein BJ554DRAFT_1570 [Olpidium bornovanus]